MTGVDLLDFPDEQLRAAWSSSFLSKLPAQAAKAILETAHEEEIQPGQTIYRELVEPRFMFAALVISGLVRVYVTSPKGRRLTVRYARAGDVIGLPSLLQRGAKAGGEVLTKG